MESVEGVAQAGYFEERYGHRAWGWYSRLLANVVRYSRPGPILDVGAGHGLFTEAATRWGMDCVGIEGSRHGLEMAQARFPENRIVQGVLQEPLPFDDEQFQTVQMHQVIVCVAPDVVHFAFTEALRVLKPGGMFFVAVRQQAQAPGDGSDHCERLYAEGARRAPQIGWVHRPHPAERSARRSGSHENRTSNYVCPLPRGSD